MKHSETTKHSGETWGFVGQFLLFLLLVGILTAIVFQSLLLHRAQAAGPEEGGTMEQIDPMPEVTPTPVPTPPPYVAGEDLQVVSTEQTRPENFITSTEVEVNGEQVENYTANREIRFGGGNTYTDLKGVITFRGNNYRTGATYGSANLVNRKFGQSWQISTGSLQAPDGNVWTGSGWTGQPLIVEWEPELRRQMNLYDSAREKDGLKEVIYPCMDGYIYFLDLDTGEKTRDPLNIGYTFKGTASLDPRGYPLLYLGSGYHSNRGDSRAFIISLIDGEILYTFGNGDEFAHRAWSMFDGSPLVDAETDTLIYPGENGILYLIHLNSQYDPAAGTVSVDPDEVVKWRYTTTRNGDKYWLGMEASPVVWNGNLIMADNGGNLMCLDLDTLEVLWVQDVLDDTNSTPVLDVEDGHPYIYISTSFHLGWRSWDKATIPVWKIDALNGEIVWKTEYSCHSVSGVSGGAQGTIAVGKHELDDRIFVAMSRTPEANTGILAALDKQTGETIWAFESKVYSWSSPADFYDDSGKGYLIYTTSGGYIYLIDGLTGEILDSRDLEGNIEASPVVYNDRVVVGHRKCKIFGIKLT